ncbi:MAG TPA: A24 family peptidase [bacterium]|nr:A24 family peptidase [bacterium]
MTDALYLLGAALLGFLAGGIANARIMRTKESLIFTTSRSCSICAAPAHPKEMLPFVGYFAVKGRCHRCKAVIPWQYPATEFAFAALFAVFAARALGMWGLVPPDFVASDALWVLFVRDALVACALVLIFIFDYRAFIIPDRITIPAMIIAIICNVALGLPVVSILLGGFLLGGFFAVQFLMSQGRWVGGGDIRMGMLMGFLLGPWLGVEALLLSYVAGAAVGVGLLLTKKRDMDSHVPFGTFMAIGTVVTLLWGQQLLDWYLGFFG